MRRASSSVPMPFSVTSTGTPPGHLGGPPDRGLQRLGPELVAHLRQFDAVLGTEGAVGPDARARVGLHADEVVVAGGLEVHVLHVPADAVAPLLAAVDRLVVAHGQRQTDVGTARARADGGDALVVGVDEDVVDRPPQLRVAPPGGNTPAR